MKNIGLLGATGSIGTQTIEVIKNHPQCFKLITMSVGKNISLAEEIIHTFIPEVVPVLTKSDRDYLQARVPQGVKVVYGEEGLIEVSIHSKTDILVNAVVGSVGLVPTLQAIEAGKTIAIANKETLVTAGHLVVEKAKEHGVDLLPVDSEHSAIFQCLHGENKQDVKHLILTASGGSFRDKSRKQLENVTVEDALNHPNWSMGAKITIDSATMMNKGLEVIEAHWLFDIPYEHINVLLHKESIIHSMVEYKDHSILAQLGTPDMKIPIQYALTYPSRMELPSSKRLNLSEIGELHFSKVDFERFRCLQYAYDAGRIGGSMPTVLNAANEQAVGHFLSGSISFLQIESLIERALKQHESIKRPSLQTIREVDEETRKYVDSLI